MLQPQATLWFIPCLRSTAPKSYFSQFCTHLFTILGPFLNATRQLYPPFCFLSSTSAYFDYKEDGAFPNPPSYNVATSLPSYDEAERTKAETTVPLVAGRVSCPAPLFLPTPLHTLPRHVLGNICIVRLRLWSDSQPSSLKCALCTPVEAGGGLKPGSVPHSSPCVTTSPDPTS